jgi:antitoxin YefM
MIAINFTTARSRLKDFCDKVTDEAETVIVTRKAEKNVVIISAERYNELEKAERNAAYLSKLERGLSQVRAGQGIVKTMDELEAMAEDGV